MQTKVANPMRIFVTGGTGLLGNNLLRLLPSAGHDSITLVRGDTLLCFRDVRHHQAVHLGRRRSTIYLPELLLKQAAPDSRQAETCLHRAIDLARSQHAKSLELRAAMSLSRLWYQHGKKEEASRLLKEIYGWFTEGFDSPDLQEAKALLEELM